MKHWSLTILLAFGLIVAGQVSAQGAALNVVATTTIIADVAQNVAGEFAQVSALLPPNTDTHSYQPTPQDVAWVADADLLLADGAGYETFLSGLLENAGNVPAVVVSNGVSILRFNDSHEATPEAGETDTLGVLGEDLTCDGELDAEATDNHHAHGTCDPHIWMDPQNVIIWTRNIADALVAADPDHADAYRANANAYTEQLQTLDDELHTLLDAVPAERRVLVTNHEFMGYFARAFGFTVVATILPSVSTEAELDPQALATLIETVQAVNVPAIFAEVTANSQVAEIVAQEAGVNVITSLYSEALSGADGPADTYIHFMEYDAHAIAAALSSGS